MPADHTASDQPLASGRIEQLFFGRLFLNSIGTASSVNCDAVKTRPESASVAHAIDAECRLYDRLFTAAEPDAKGDFKKNINPHSLEVVTAKCEPSLKDAKPELRYQFERLAYFALDSDTQPGKLVFNRTITLKDAWAKIEQKRN